VEGAFNISFYIDRIQALTFVMKFVEDDRETYLCRGICLDVFCYRDNSKEKLPVSTSHNHNSLYYSNNLHNLRIYLCRHAMLSQTQAMAKTMAKAD
jgi:hypothetical protein